ncbi:Xaa-Pro aminopeptidase [Mesorhizobium sp. RP14(2022)]|uniref:Xaa-Pro aminopeptidase n=1 Tax=Mesorhizobium liriopis TaxID=2953882 RepID=A0ABT1C3C2_9HYPH|nr:Xaa-Pro aminopeptidase [Mesorhizobium liriopis]MCO6048998.1 Xaa-Pro aminopeptidase [Mesorhizobium liriopis]
MPIALKPVALPDFGPLGRQPTVPPATYAARADELYRRAGLDWVVVYADREHFGNVMFLSGFEPRFEEALLLLGPGERRVLITGNESESYAALAQLPGLDVMRAQSLSLMGQDRSVEPKLAIRLRDAGIRPGDTVGLVGWKYFEPEEDEEIAGLFFVPDSLAGMLRRLAGELRDVTPILMHPETGLRSVVDVDQIAAFEWAAARCSSALWQVVSNVKVGDTEFSALGRLPYEGDPLNVHTMFASAGPGGAVIGLRSPSARRLSKGDGVTTALGLWGALSSRAGLLDDGNDAFLLKAKSYFEALIAWYHTAEIGLPGGELFSAVTEKLAQGGLQSALNPGHLGSHEEWLHSPVRPGSDDRLRSGMVFQVDVIPVPMPAGQALNNEDAVVFADGTLRAELAQKYPEAWARIEARRRFMADQLGVPLKDSILPLSSTPLYLPPFWLRPDHVLVRD